MSMLKLYPVASIHLLWSGWEISVIVLLPAILAVSIYFILSKWRKRIQNKGKEQTNELAKINARLQHQIHELQLAILIGRKDYEKKLVTATAEAKAANEAKNEFLATISHELRTHLNAIIGFDECILMGMDGPINESQRESLEKIEQSSLRLLNLFNDILDLSKIEANRMELEIVPCNIVEIVVSCVEEMLSLAMQKGLLLHLSLDRSFIATEVNQMRIKQVILNVLSNAIKFTPQGSITVSIHQLPHEAAIKVTDTGIGLTAEEMKKIFLPFAQADSSITQKYGGTGLGLTISRRIMELHGGTISVESKKEEGSTFTITLPRS